MNWTAEVYKIKNSFSSRFLFTERNSTGGLPPLYYRQEALGKENFYLFKFYRSVSTGVLSGKKKDGNHESSLLYRKRFYTVQQFRSQSTRSGHVPASTPLQLFCALFFPPFSKMAPNDSLSLLAKWAVRWATIHQKDWGKSFSALRVPHVPEELQAVGLPQWV